ncbi:YidC/Oxa1 family membrane protein insertase [Streptomyces orinoci]|uniref:Membrane protein insertase YidC n=1 Tax=Streptomyces orinoci TaxID=67339 RepID=A0ABV3JQW1_STRON|nr:membrane protein insertase YidC [Streptomyces orinoci]
MSLFTTLGALLSQLAELLRPLFGASATAAAIVLLTLCVRLALHPLARSAARGQRAKAGLAPRIAELRRRHGKDPERLRRALGEVYAEAGVSPLAGCLPTLAQLPAFYVMYHLFATGSGAGGPLTHTLLGAPLNGHCSAAHWGVYLGLFLLVAAVATWNVRRTPPVPASAGDLPPGAGAVAKAGRWLSFGTLVTVAVVPLAAALYVVTSSVWSAVERACLEVKPVPADGK